VTGNGNNSETSVLVGLIPCPVPTGEKSGGPHFTHVVVSCRATGVLDPESADIDDRRKRAMLGPGYSAEPVGRTIEGECCRVSHQVWQQVN
jgi:hypothetical protein